MLSKKIHIQKKWPLKFKQSFSVNKLTKYHDGIVTHLFVFVLQNIFWSWVIFCTNCAFPISIVGLFTYKEYRFHVLWTRFFYPINILNQLRKYLNGKYDYSFTEINKKYQCNVYLLMAEDGQKRSSIQLPENMVCSKRSRCMSVKAICIFQIDFSIHPVLLTWFHCLCVILWSLVAWFSMRLFANNITDFNHEI